MDSCLPPAPLSPEAGSKIPILTTFAPSAEGVTSVWLSVWLSVGLLSSAGPAGVQAASAKIIRAAMKKAKNFFIVVFLQTK